MSTKREEERNEKIIRGLMKLPPNRRCINCNSLGPQYVCTNFWTFICTVCSGIHREFTHRVKSVSMAKFTSQEVDALQKGGNQRAKELVLKAWDPERNRLPDNSNVDKLREFIKNVYVHKKYSIEKSSDKPPRDPQSLRSHEDETRRASSYHSYSQSPPYDFQYEERRSGKHAPTLTRRTGSDHRLYDGKLTDFLSPSHSSYDSFTSEGSYPRASDYSFSSGGDALRSDVFSSSPRRDIGSPSSEASGEMSNKVPHLRQKSNASSASFGSFDSSTSFKSVNFVPEVRAESPLPVDDPFDKPSAFPSLPQSSAAETFNGLDLFSAPFAPHSVVNTLPTGSNSQPLPVSAEPVNVATQSSISSIPTFNEQQPPPISRPPLVDMLTTQQQPELKQPPSLDLFAALSEEQSKIPQLPPVDLSQQHPKLPEASQMPQRPPVDLFDGRSQLQSKVMMTSQRPETSSLDLFSASPQLSATPQTSELQHTQALDLFSIPQQRSEMIQPPPLDAFAVVFQKQLAASPRGNDSNVLPSGDGGWASFDMLQSIPIDAKSSASDNVSSSGGNFLQSSNPFAVDQNSYQDSAAHESSALSHDFGCEHLQNIGVNFNNTDLWDAFSSSSGEQINPSVLKTDEQSGVHCTSDANNSIVFGAYEALHYGRNLRNPGHTEPLPSGASSHLSMNMMPNDFPMASGVAGVQLAADDKPTNPFDLPYGSHMVSGSMSQFWDMSSLQTALPNTKLPNASVGGVNESWFPQNSFSSYVPGGVSYDSSAVSLGFMAAKAPASQIPNIHVQGPVASVGGNPFA